MASRNPGDTESAQVVVREIDDDLTKIRTKEWDFHRRRIRNASPSIDPYDYVVQKELTDAITSIQDQINTTSPSRSIRSGTPYIDPRSLGAIGDGLTNDTSAWIASINLAISTGLPIFGGNRTYLVSKQGSYTLPWDTATHHYVFLVTSPIIIQDAKFKLSITDANTANVFMFRSTSNVYLSRISSTGVGSMATLKLYEAAAVVFDRCTSCQATEIYTNNMRGNTLFFQGSDCEVSHSFSNIPTTNLAGSHFASYGCSRVTIRDCTSYGGSHDGDIVHFGTNTNNLATGNRTLNCAIHNYALGDATRAIVFDEAQGLLLDSGQEFGAICDCYAYGYYYGIDVKTTCTGSLVQGNTIEKCKVGIAVRRGEGDAPTYDTQVLGNLIRPMGGNGNSASIFSGLTLTVGMFLEDALGVTVSGNIVEASWLFGAGQQDYIAIFGKTTGTFPPSISQNDGFLITNNKFINEMDVGGNYTYTKNATVWLVGRSDNLLVRGKLDGNNFKTYNGGTVTQVIVSITQCEQFSISNNHFGRIVGDYQAIIVSSATQLDVSGNTFAGAAGFISLTNVDMITIKGNQFGIAGRNLTTTLPVPIIYGATVSHVVVEGNVQNQTINGNASLDDGRFFETSAAGNVDIAITNNVMEKLIFVADWYKINAIANSMEAGMSVIGNIVNGVTAYSNPLLNQISADCSALLTCSTAFADVTGATVTLPFTGMYIIIASFNSFVDQAAGGVIGRLVVNGVAQTGQVELTIGALAAASAVAMSISRQWIYNNSGSNVAKLQALKSVNAGTGQVKTPGTNITAVFLG